MDAKDRRGRELEQLEVLLEVTRQLQDADMRHVQSVRDTLRDFDIPALQAVLRDLAEMGRAVAGLDSRAMEAIDAVMDRLQVADPKELQRARRTLRDLDVT